MDLKTTYMGLELKNPLTPSASPLSKEIDSIKELEDAGAAAIVLQSLFEEQIASESDDLDYYLDRDAESSAEARSYFPDLKEYNVGPDGYLEHIRKAKDAVDVPIIASLNGITNSGWTTFAGKMQEAGADAIELNVYFVPTDPTLSGAAVEDLHVDILSGVKKAVDIPVAIKLSPFFSSLPHIARRLDEAGADAMVLFNRFYQPDIDIEELNVTPNLRFSTSSSGRLPMRWIAILKGQINASIAASTGVHTAEDAVKMLMAGADVAMMTAALLQNGPGHLKTVLDEMTEWLVSHEYESVRQLCGSMSHRNSPNPREFERANYMRALASIGKDGARRF